MKTKDFIDGMGLTVLSLADGDREIKNGYAGDFLSYAISKIGDNSVWFTVMNNVNVLGVATLADVSLVVVCDDVSVPEDTVSRAVTQRINLCKCAYDVYNSCVKSAKLLKKD